MNFVTMLALALVRGSGAGGPAGPPTSVSLYTYDGGSKVGVQWTWGDPTASTQLGQSTTQGVEPDSVFTNVAARVASKETETTTTGLNCGDRTVTNTYWWVRHVKNGEYTDWVESSDYACS